MQDDLNGSIPQHVLSTASSLLTATGYGPQFERKHTYRRRNPNTFLNNHKNDTRMLSQPADGCQAGLWWYLEMFGSTIRPQAPVLSANARAIALVTIYVTEQNTLELVR